jgi:hypothetical protein
MLNKSRVGIDTLGGADHLELNMPITSFIRMPASAALHLPARTAVGDKQDQDLEKGGGIGKDKLMKGTTKKQKKLTKNSTSCHA